MHQSSPLGILDWLLPPQIFRLLTFYRPAELAFFLTHYSVLAANGDLRNRHAGERGFILCNGPSVKRQNIRPLARETVFSVSSGFHHPDFDFVRPRYHCVPQLTYGELTEEKAVTFFQLMNEKIGGAELFLATQEYDLVYRHGLFPGRKIHYVCLAKRYPPSNARQIPDLTKPVLRVQTVPVMVLMIAMFMGFRELYLLGTDHDWFVTKRYDYFFDRSALGWTDAGVKEDGALQTTLLDELSTIRKVWEQYQAIAQIASFAGIKIYNATDGGMLDVFERKRLEDVVG
jgi:hypothetical protein